MLEYRRYRDRRTLALLAETPLPCSATVISVDESRTGMLNRASTESVCSVFLLGGGPVCKAGLRCLIALYGDLVVACKLSEADVIVIDLDTSGAVPLVVASLPRVPISGDPKKIASGALPRSASPATLIDAIRTAYASSRRQSRVGMLLGAVGTRGSNSASLSLRQSEVASLIARGLRYGEVAERLRISPHTVKNHAKVIFEKLNVNSRVQLAVYWRLHRLEPPMVRSTGSTDL